MSSDGKENLLSTPMTPYKSNLLANFAGTGFAALLQLAFIPLYVRFLGVEAYGLIGFYIMFAGALVVSTLGWVIFHARTAGLATLGVLVGTLAFSMVTAGMPAPDIRRMPFYNLRMGP